MPSIDTLPTNAIDSSDAIRITAITSSTIKTLEFLGIINPLLKNG